MTPNDKIHLANDIVSKCGLTNQHSTADPRLVTCPDCRTDEIYERPQEARIYCTCDSTDVNRNLKDVCPTHRITLQQAIEGDEIPFPQNDRRSHAIPSEHIDEPNPEREYKERRQIIRRTYDREHAHSAEIIPKYQDPLEVLWLCVTISNTDGRLVNASLVEAKTEVEARELCNVGVVGYYQRVSNINFSNCAGVFKL
jgi:hypothetical protein